MVVAVLVSPALGQETLPDRFQHKIRSERENIEHHVPGEWDYRIACEFTGQVGQSGIPPADHNDSSRAHLRHTVNPPELPGAVAETPESGFQAAILRIRAHPRQKPVTDDEAAIVPLDEHADLGDRISWVFPQFDDSREFEDCSEWRCGDSDLRLFAGCEEHRYGNRDQSSHARQCHPESKSPCQGGFDAPAVDC